MKKAITVYFDEAFLSGATILSECAGCDSGVRVLSLSGCAGCDGGVTVVSRCAGCDGGVTVVSECAGCDVVLRVLSLSLSLGMCSL